MMTLWRYRVYLSDPSRCLQAIPVKTSVQLCFSYFFPPFSPSRLQFSSCLTRQATAVLPKIKQEHLLRLLPTCLVCSRARGCRRLLKLRLLRLRGWNCPSHWRTGDAMASLWDSARVQHPLKTNRDGAVNE